MSDALKGRVVIRLNPEMMDQLTRGPDGLLGRYVRNRMTLVQLAAIRQCPKRTGKLSESIVKRDYPLLNGYGGTIVALQPYAIYVHDGTKAHGPKTKQAMRWMGDDGQYVFATWVRGITANRFLSDNLPLIFE